MQKKTDEFWEKERLANSTRKKDISELPYFKVPANDVLTPPDNAGDDEKSIQFYIDKINDSLNTPMIDLSEYSNTDLKLAYGVGNFKRLSEYDENFNNFLIQLSNLASAYAENNYKDRAVLTYQLALDCGSKKLSDYTNLAKLYLDMDKPEMVDSLISSIESSDNKRKSSIINELKLIIATYQ